MGSGMGSLYLGRLLMERLARGERCTPAEELPQPLRRLQPPPGTRIGDGRVCVEQPMELALYLARRGVSEKLVAAALDWRMFEDYASRALREAGFATWRGLRLHGRGGFEVDVLGLDTYGRGVVFECKHWSPRSSSPSRLRAVAARHLERVKRLAASWTRLGLPRGRRYRLLPAVLVLREQGVPRLAAGVPIVPVSRLRGFLEALDELLWSPEVATVEAPAEGIR